MSAALLPATDFSFIFVCVVFCAAIVVTDAECPRPRKIELALLQPIEGELGFERTAAASTMAVRDAQAKGLLNGTAIEVIAGDDGRDGKTALGLVSRMLKTGVDAFFGLPYSSTAIDAGKLICYWNTTWLSYYSLDGSLGNSNVYNTLLRIMTNYERMSTALVKLFNTHKWTLAALVYNTSSECGYSATTIKDVFVACGIAVKKEFGVNISAINTTLIASQLKTIQALARVVVVCGNSTFVRQFMLTAHRMGMTNGEYVFISYNQLPPDNIRTLWRNNDSSDPEAKAAYAKLLTLTVALQTNNARVVEFLGSIPKMMSLPPWNYSATTGKKLTASRYALFLYDAVYLYLSITEKMLKDDHCDLQNGTAYQEYGKFWTFEGLSGNVVLDDNTDRIMDYYIWNLPDDKDFYEIYMVVPLAENVRTVTLCSKDLVPIVMSNLTLPSDRPRCGFLGELCIESRSTYNEFLVTLISIVSLALVLMLSFGYFFYRRKKFQEEVAMMKWKVKFSDIVFASSCRPSVASMGKMAVSNEGIRASRRSSVAQSPSVGVASYNNYTVAVKFLDRENVDLSSEDLLELKTMRDLHSENLNIFIGLCIETARVCILTMYCSRGSLKDILDNEQVKLDQNFKISFVGDIIKGMECLHRSPLRHHGRLKTSNVLIDSRWTAKITDWGLNRCRNPMTDKDDEDTCAELLWTAPEVLRNCSLSPHSLQKADVYSFGIIVQEIVFRAGPFPLANDLLITNKDIVRGVVQKANPPLRPFLPGGSNVDAKLIDIIQESWNEDANLRPSFALIKNRFYGFYKGHLNIMDGMLKMMEKYADNLEELVQERTHQLEEEKKKTDTLLYSMLPKYVADKLKSGKNVNPETFPEVSIYFSDIVSFTTLAAESSPMEVVSFLNDLYIAFDEVISKYNVYKVETIGDAYMVASGVPVMNPHHASEIARMSLSIRDRVHYFKIRHRPDCQLRIRIGMHSGSVVAGIVGMKMPRYCLFGDTVNTASRMESTGQAMCIQLSEAAYRALKGPASRFYMTKRGEIEIKGKGMQTTYWLEGYANSNF